MTALDIVPLCDDSGHILRADLADTLCALHRQLRPMLPDHGAAYLAKMQRVCHYGARLVAALDSDGRPVGMALYRVYEIPTRTCACTWTTWSATRPPARKA